ncbi:mutT/nudix family protein [Gimesia maris DSM 8797]|nr:mutT/nudix family protein [Gimesia maris DSM 8797]
MFGGAEVVPGRKPAMWGDPQDHITNRCHFRQCKSGKNRPICSEEYKQVARVSVHCKLGTRATQINAYRQWRDGVKFSLSSRGDPIFTVPSIQLIVKGIMREREMQIRTKVIISLIHQGQVLLSEGFDPSRKFQFYIPVGGGVEFRERLQDAAARELFEELGLKDQTLEFLNFHESIFEFNGVPEHEIMYHYQCRISDSVKAALLAEGIESDGATFKVTWFTGEELAAIRKGLVPPKIYDDLCPVLLQDD